MSKLKKGPEKIKPDRPVETKGIGLERISRGTVVASSEALFQLKMSGNNYKIFKRCDSKEYNQPQMKTQVRCIYHGRKDSTFPYAVYDLSWNLLYRE